MNHVLLEKQKNQMTISKQEIREQQETKNSYSYKEKFEDGMRQMQTNNNQDQRQGKRFNNKFHHNAGFNKSSNIESANEFGFPA